MDKDNTLGAVGTTEGLALTLAVVYHGFACLADNSIPAKINTITHTADVFEDYLKQRKTPIA